MPYNNFPIFISAISWVNTKRSVMISFLKLCNNIVLAFVMLYVDLLIDFIVDLIVVILYLFYATSHEQEYCFIEYQPSHTKLQIIAAMKRSNLQWEKTKLLQLFKKKHLFSTIILFYPLHATRIRWSGAQWTQNLS